MAQKDQNGTVALTGAAGHARGWSNVEPKRLRLAPKAEPDQGFPNSGRRVECDPELSFRVNPSNAAHVNRDGANIRARRADCFRDRLFCSTPADNDVGNGIGGDGHGRLRGWLRTTHEP